MDFAINPNIKGVLFPPIMEIKRLVIGDSTADNLAYIDLCQAIPDYAPPAELSAHLQRKISDPSTALYTADEGLYEVREAACRRYERVYQAKISPENICLTTGASQAFWLAMMTLCQAGDEVIIQAPTYFDYDMALRMMGVTCTYAPFKENCAGLPDVGEIGSLVTAKTKAILLVSPSNPTGMVIPSALFSSLYELAEARRIALVVDETYADFLPTGAPPHALFELENWGKHLIHIMSFGKSYAMTGYRAGALIASEPFLAEALKAHDTMAICQATPTQLALGYAFDQLDEWVASKRQLMERRHDCFVELFNQKDNPFKLVTSGAFFAWIKHPWQELSASQVVRELVKKAGLITLPGEIFGPNMSAYIRVAFGNITEETIPEAVERFRRFRL